MNKTSNIFKINMLVICMIVMTNGCLSDSTSRKTPQNTLALLPTTSLTSATLVEPSLVLTPTRPSTPSLTLTQTSPATLVNGNAAESIRDLIETNGGCKLPCIWGIMPGKGTWIEVESYMFALGAKIDHVGPAVVSRDYTSYIADTYYVNFFIPERPRGIGLRIGVFDGVVWNIFLGDESSGELFGLNKLLSEYGIPQDVYIYTVADFPGGDLPFTLAIFYPHQDFIAIYKMNAQKSNGMLIGCPMGTLPQVITWSQDESRYIYTNQILEWIEGYGNPTYYSKKLQDVTDMNLDTFYSIFSDSNSSMNCIKSPEENWPFH